MTLYTHTDMPGIFGNKGVRMPSGVYHPRSWFRTASQQQLSAAGFRIYEPPEPEPPTLAERKAILKDQVKRHGDSIPRGGFPHDFGSPYGIQHLQLRNDTDRTNWLTSQAAYQAQIGAGNDRIDPLYADALAI